MPPALVIANTPHTASIHQKNKTNQSKKMGILIMKSLTIKRSAASFLAILMVFTMFGAGSFSAFAADSSVLVDNEGINLVPSFEVESSVLNPLSRGTLTWSKQSIGYDTRMRFVSSYTGGYFTLDGVTATFSVSINNGASESIEIDWCDSNGNVTVLYTGTTSSKTVSYTASGRVSGNFRVWNKSVAAITVDASISY